MKLNIETSGSGEKRDQLHKCDFYIAIVTPSFVNNTNCLGEMKDANYLKKEMYALLDKKTILPPEFFDVNWTLVLKYGNDFEFKKSSQYLKELIESK